MKTAYSYHMLLRQLRLQQGLTQSQVAERLGETQSYVSKYECAEQRLDLYELERVCHAIDISLLDFIHLYVKA